MGGLYSRPSIVHSEYKAKHEDTRKANEDDSTGDEINRELLTE